MNEEKNKKATDLYDFFDEIRTCFHTMTELSERILFDHNMTPPQRNVLLELLKVDSKTVSKMAKERPVSRQRMQVIVNGLLEKGYVSSIDNPNHAKSNLIKITEKGEKIINEIIQREANVVKSIDWPFSNKKVKELNLEIKNMKISMLKYLDREGNSNES